MPVLAAALTLLQLAGAPAPAVADSGRAADTAAVAASALGPRLVTRFDAERAWTLAVMPSDTPPPTRRPRAIVHSDAYYTRLAIHRYASYAILPLFAGEYYVGQRVLNDEPQRSSLRGMHTVLGLGIFAAFAANTVTGVWNLWEARHDPGAARRDTHVILMLLADAGFAATAATIPHRHREFVNGFPFYTFDTSRARTHKDIAIGSIALGTIGTGLMWLWK